MIRLSSSICFCIAVSMGFSLLNAVNLMSMKARYGWVSKSLFAPALGAEPEVAGCENADDGLKVLG